MKRCTQCGEEKSLEAFGKKLDRLTSACKECLARIRRESYPEHAEQIKAARKSYYESNKEKVRACNDAWLEKNFAKILEYNRRYYHAKFKEKKAARAKLYMQENKAAYAARSQERRALLQNACPAWADISAIFEAYKFRESEERRIGIKLHVDHIIPIKGKGVCGLHVPWNLRVTSAAANWSKNNRYQQSDARSLSGSWEVCL